MKNLFFGLLLLASGGAVLGSCKKAEDELPAPLKEDLPLIFPRATPGKDSLNLENVRYSRKTLEDSAAQNPQGGFVRPTIEFTFNPTQRDIKVRTVEVYKSYGVGSDNNYSYTPRVKVGEYTSFPVTYSVGSDELFSGLNLLSSNELFPVIRLSPDGTEPATQTRVNITNNSAVLFTFEYILEDGRRIILTPLDRAGNVTGTFTNPPYAVRILTKSGYGLKRK